MDVCYLSWNTMKDIRMSLRLSRNPDQSWRDAAIEQARRFGMEIDVAEYFDICIAAGDTDSEAAWNACYEWDVLDFIPDDDTQNLKEDRKEIQKTLGYSRVSSSSPKY